MARFGCLRIDSRIASGVCADKEKSVARAMSVKIMRFIQKRIVVYFRKDSNFLEIFHIFA